MDNLKSWDKILVFIKERISPVNFRGWFSKTKLVDLNDKAILIAVPSAFIKNQLILRYDKLIQEAISENLNKSLEIKYEIDPSLDTKIKDLTEEQPFEFQSPSFISKPQSSSPLNSKYTLKNFVVGLTNNLAFAAALAVVQNPGISYNPLFIYGPSGVGKTHLMQAIGNVLLEKDPYLKIIYAPSEKFTNDMVYAIQTNKNADFRQKYRSCQLLLIDDVQFISGKDSTQEEFFHTFNELQSKNAQIVLTSDRSPVEIEKIESRLRTRFQGGLMVDIQTPDFGTRMAILKEKIAEKGESLPEEILRSIAEVSTESTRELEGKLTQILQAAKLSSEPMTLEQASRFLGKSIKPSGVYDFKKVLATINQYFNIKMADLTGPRRQKELVLPRQIAMYILYEDCRIPMEKIGDILGGRDHTTILYGIEKIRANLSQDREMQRLINEVKGAL
ncbi:chromosomal replication initiator protein DnaA [Candidatus Daviesbacteria bacterium]|nr:chromosomal replication initiator protein DnaA [Candidatus Daviesbacteria bacterium]